MGILPSELIWGKECEREHFIKMILITILMNNKEANPFEKGDLNDWIQKEISFDPQWEENKGNELNQNALEHYYLEKYGFFINEKNYDQYLSLASETDSRYEKISNIILRIMLLSDYDFTRHFISHLINNTINSVQPNPITEDSIPEAIQQTYIERTHRTQNLIENFIIYKGQYSMIMLDGHSACYHEFISAFDNFWHAVKGEYFDFFNRKIFSKINDSTEAVNTLKILQNKDIEEVLLSDCFLDLNEKILNRISHYNTFAMLLDIKARVMLNIALQDGYFMENLDKKNVFNTPGLTAYKNTQKLDKELDKLIKFLVRTVALT